MLRNILKFKEHDVKRNHSNIDYAFEIQRLKKLKNAIILAHVYQSADIQKQQTPMQIQLFFLESNLWQKLQKF